MEFGNVLFEICERTDKQADKQTYMQTLITILCTPSEVNVAKRTKLAKQKSAKNRFNYCNVTYARPSDTVGILLTQLLTVCQGPVFFPPNLGPAPLIRGEVPSLNF